MANATTNSAQLKGSQVAYLVLPLKASTQFYRGGHVMLVGGYLTPCADTSGGTYAGRFLDPDVLTTSAADGTFSGKVTPPNMEPYQQFTVSGADNTWNGTKVFFTNDYMVAQSSSNSVIAGRVVKELSSTVVIVDTTQRWT